MGRVRVVQEASPIAFSSNLPPPPVEMPYGLMVANITSIKNFQVLVSALTKLMARGSNPCICFVGRNDSSDDAIERARSLGLNLRVLGSLDEEALKRYYAHARFYLNTSLVEGFCLPILEAHTFGLPVVCSDLPVLHEVAGDGALFFDPRNDEELADAIFKILHDDALAQRLSAAAHQNAKRFSWERAANETESVFETLLHRPEHALGPDTAPPRRSLTA
jgi:glycosyltransferase involved in cell wall biosynthesis